MTSYRPIEDASRDFATLVLLASLVPAVFQASGAESTVVKATPTRVAAAVFLFFLIVDGFRAIRLLAAVARRGLSRFGHGVPFPGRGLALWGLDLISREALTDPDEARESLARLCGYRLHGEGYRVVSVVPSVQRWRVGVWVTLARPSAFTRRWECRYVRWIDDPHELWLLRSALKGSPRRPQAPRGEAHAIALEEINGDEIDELLGGTERRRADEPPRPGKSRP